MEILFSLIIFLEDFFWSYVGWILIVISGIYLTYISKGLQFKALFHFKTNLKEIYAQAHDETYEGINPFKLYFASVGGMVGLGNIVFITTAVMIGGPGSIFWIILASLSGMLLKYSEIYLGMKYRIKNEKNGFDGGPMYFLQHAFKGKQMAYLFAVLLCLYGVEISNFLIIVDRVEYSFHFDRNLIIFTFLIIVIYSSIGGISRLANICSTIMPIFMLGYVVFAIYVISCHYSLLPSFFKTVLISAFTGHAPIGGFIGSTMILSAYLGISKTVYSGDIGIGYDSIMQSETRIVCPRMQAILAIYALLTDTLICLLTNIMVGVTGAWHIFNHLAPSDIVARLLADYIPYSDLFMTLLLFFAGYTTIIAYLAAGTKCAKFISPKYGRFAYLLYAMFAFVFFCSFSQNNVMIIMGLLSGMLVLINIIGILRLRKNIEF
ncbi:MAG: sodium:alanine symporter family protein [Rickettsiaceae bacterium]|nr:sodium:alanine symporter family protein [Rickettsiaceae bacterium]